LRRICIFFTRAAARTLLGQRDALCVADDEQSHAVPVDFAAGRKT
jgi:hypothetical protein